MMLRIFLLMIVMANSAVAVEPPARMSKLRDIATVEGVRDNPLIGYGLVIGLNGTGDRRQTIFTTQMLANILNQTGISALAQANQMQQGVLSLLR